MVDLNKEIKISDLFKRSKKSKSGGSGRRRPAPAPKRPKKQELVGLKVGASQIAASRVVNNGSPKLVQLARTSLAAALSTCISGSLPMFPSAAVRSRRFA